jgi:hypothetical protein
MMATNERPTATAGLCPRHGHACGVVFAIDVAQMWSEEASQAAGKPVEVSLSTVWSYVGKSKPGGRYEDHPVPEPRRAGRSNRSALMWTGCQRGELRAWWKARPGAGYRSDLD